jgi:hypothetical protein
MSALRWALHRLGRVSWAERRALVEACVLLPSVHLLQRRLPFARWHALLLRPAHQRPGVGSPALSARQLAWAVGVAADWLPGEYKCLPRAYAAHWLLTRHGHACELQVGVARDAQGKVEAHAWVVYQGEIIVGLVENMQRFVRLPDLGRVLP